MSRPEIDTSPVVLAGYVRQLAVFAVDLSREAGGRCDPTAIRRTRQRLTQWIEDLRSVGGDAELIRAVEELVARLSAALSAPTDLAAEVTAVSEVLAQLSTAASSPGKKPGRPAFWK